jgi:hypothetical protein
VEQKYLDISGNIECKMAFALPHVLESKFEVPTAMMVEVPIFWDTTSYKLFYRHESLSPRMGLS